MHPDPMEDIVKAHAEGYAAGRRAGENFGITKTLDALSLDRFDIADKALGHGAGMTGGDYKANLERIAAAIDDWCDTRFIMETPAADDGSYSEYRKGQ